MSSELVEFIEMRANQQLKVAQEVRVAARMHNDSRELLSAADKIEQVGKAQLAGAPLLADHGDDGVQILRVIASLHDSHPAYREGWRP